MSENHEGLPTYSSIEQSPPNYYALNNLSPPLDQCESVRPPNYEDVITPEELLALDQQTAAGITSASGRTLTSQYLDLPDVWTYTQPIINRPRRQASEGDAFNCFLMLLVVFVLFIYGLFKLFQDPCIDDYNSSKCNTTLKGNFTILHNKTIL